jgi:DME family drug/metabolite transporter
MGELAGVGAAIIWATTNIVLRGQSVRLGAVTVNAWRTVFAAICFVIIFLLTRPLSTFGQLPLQGVAALLTGVIFGMVIGDVLQFTAMTRIGVARAMPISSCFPLFTIAIAAVLLGERITGRTIIGAVLVIAGVVLVALPSRVSTVNVTEGSTPPASLYWIGVAMALGAAICWSCSTTLSRIALRDIDVITANTIRMPFSAAVSLLLNLRGGGMPVRKFGRRSMVILILCGIIGTAGGGFLYLTAIELAGAAKTAVLSSAAPIFGLIGSVIFLHERPSRRGIIGTLISFAGIVLVV